MGSTYQVVVSGPMPAAAVGTVRERFDDVRISETPAATVIECSLVDQAALRGLLTSVWDMGGAVLLVVQLVDSEERNRHGHDQR